MALGRIKTRESVKDIKILDNAAVVSERMKTALVRSKDQAENLMDDGQISPSECDRSGLARGFRPNEKSH